MPVHIISSACISHSPTFKHDFWFENAELERWSNTMAATEPDYKTLLPPASLRRMSHIVKMGLGAGILALKQAGITTPEGIIYATGIGCIEETNKFLDVLTKNNETLLTPTAFIQSTHNTVAGQMALFTNCKGYNNNFVHQNLSFEYALMDAIGLLNTGALNNVLVGSSDELTGTYIEMMQRAGYLKSSPTDESGFIAGEGATAFILANSNNEEGIKIEGIECAQAIENHNDLQKMLGELCSLNNIQLHEIDLILSGACSDQHWDNNLNSFSNATSIPTGQFKNLCGEFYSASAFGFWLAVQLLNGKQVPAPLKLQPNLTNVPKRILIVNHYKGESYSMTLVAKER